MPLTTTLSAMRDAVYRTSDSLQFTDKHPTSRVNDLINQGIGALSRLCRTTNPEFQPIASTTETTDGTSTTWELPDDFRSLLMVEYVDDNGWKSWLLPFEPSEHASLTSAMTTEASLRATTYRIVGTNIELEPLAPAGHTFTYWYATNVTQLVEGGDTLDTMDRLDTYVIWWAAREIAQEREAWQRYDRLSQQLASLEADIRILARSIDLSHPARVVNLRNAPFRQRRVWGTRWGWRRW